MTRRTTRAAAALLAAALLLGACGDDEDAAEGAGESRTTVSTLPSGGSSTTEGTGSPAGAASRPTVTIPDSPPPKELVVKDITVGTGAEAKAGQQVTMQYVGVAYSTKQEFDASWDRGEPLGPFPLGAGKVIKGWDQGIPGMKVGGRRELTIPPDLAYGPGGFPPVIGPDETLVFVVDLVAVG